MSCVGKELGMTRKLAEIKEDTDKFGEVIAVLWMWMS